MQLYLYEGKAKKITYLTKSRSIENVGSFKWSPDGTHFYFTSQNFEKGITEVFGAAFGSKKPERLVLLKNYNLISAVGSKFILITRWDSYKRKSVFNLWNIKEKGFVPFPVPKKTITSAYLNKDESGAWFTATKWKNESAWFTSIKWNPDLRLYFYDFGSKKASLLKNLGPGVSSVSFSPDRKHVAYKIRTHGADKLHIAEVLGKGLGNAFSVPTESAGVIDGFHWRNDIEIGFDFQSIGIPREIRTYNVKTSRFETWVKPMNRGGGAPEGLNTRLIKWRSFDSLEITGFLTEPKSATGRRKLPVIIDIHSGFNTEYLPKSNPYTSFASGELGAVVIFPNIRGSGGRGPKFMDLDNKGKRQNAVRDLVALLNWIESQPNLDSDRIVVRGLGYGGFMALALGMVESKRVKGVSTYVPLVDVREYLRFLSRNYKKPLRRELGSVNDRELMRKTEKLSLLNPANLENWKTPLLLVAGQNDKYVPTESIDKLRDELRARKFPVRYIKAKDEGHTFRKYANHSFFRLAELEFFRKVFK